MTLNAPHLKPLRFLTRLFSSSAATREETLAGPIRGELLGADHLAERAREVARSQRAMIRGRGKRTTPLLKRLGETEEILAAARVTLSQGIERGINLGPAGEWLLDNFHVIMEHIQEVRESLPGGYYRELPELMSGPLAGYPRVFQLAITLISHTEGRIDLENINLFTSAFQQVTTLTIGELWAIPAMLRLGLIENVRRMALRTVQRLAELDRADEWVERIQEASESGARALNETLREFVAHPPPLTTAFVARFLQQIRLAPVAPQFLGRLEQWLAQEGLNAEEAAAHSTQRLAITQVTMANSITSLITVASMDWRLVVEHQSVMEAALRDDPSGFYPRMTFATRDSYRHSVERIAKRSRIPEETLARLAIDLARDGARDPKGDPRRGHVGFYLVDRGLPALERAAGYWPSVGEAMHRWGLRHPNIVFVGGILAGTSAALAALLWLAGPAGLAAWPAALAIGLLPAADIAVNAINQLITALLPPRMLPKLDLAEHGVPAEFRTAVVIPTLFADVDAVRESLETLEAQFLANRESNLHFGILSDFTDAETENQDGDDAIVAAAVEGVRALNLRYGSGSDDCFFLFHRPRRWNPRQGVWMGWERKRGKLAEFNHFLRGEPGDAFSVIVGDVTLLQEVRYVITLDADTVLPPDAAPLLIGSLAHPLNRAWYNPDLGRVIRGYGIIQPRVDVSLRSAHRSRFAVLHSGHPGVDPYTTAVSDVYQDLYGEGSFTGKGIYDVDAFEQATHGRFPENTLLSHDLIEGNYARAGLATDITVYDDYPRSYLSFSRRKHRWIRGDWQLLPWLGSRVPGPDGPEKNRLSLLSRWKILDNMRRSTVEIALMLLLAAGWTFLPGSPLRWTLLALGAVAAPWVVSLLLAVIRPPFDKSWRAYYSAVGRDAVTSLQQLGLAITFLPHQAWVSADAIVRTLWRLLVSKRCLLEWQSASQTERGLGSDARGAWKVLWPAVTSVGALAVLAMVIEVYFLKQHRPWQLAFSVLPLVALWLASPAIARSLNGPAYRRERRVPPQERLEAMRYALLHWRYFDRFVTAETHWLIPDNFQEDPAPVVTMRTSPTNLGFQLLAIVCAYDLRFITAETMTRRLEQAFRSLERLRRFRGHFYNWYDLRDLHVLEPGYISTVDSGNLAGYFLAVRQACLAVPDDSMFDGRVWHALEAGISLAEKHLQPLGHGLKDAEARRTMVAATDALEEAASIVAENGPVGPPLANLEALANALDRTRSALLRTAVASQELAPVLEWIDWSRTLVNDHLARIGDKVPEDVVGRGGQPAHAFASWRERDKEDATGLGIAIRLEALANRADAYVQEMDFSFLYSETRKLFTIGYHPVSHSLDSSYYDLLASEARLASFLAIAKNDAPVEHWFRLGRSLTRVDGDTALVSWTGTMFEYLMPALVMQSFPFTLLDQTYRSAVRRQIAYGGERGTPWGFSECAYNVRDRHFTYQYRAFGVPDLALRRGMGRDLVVAPYACGLAMLVEPAQALANMRALEVRGALGPYGFRDALDFTRPDPDKRWAVVRTYMAHHTGMTLVALTNALTAEIWQRRFHADPLVRAAELLLHERIPRRLVLLGVQAAPAEEALPDPEWERPAVREFDTPDTPQPHVALLGHLPYTIMVSHAGSGYSRYDDLAVTRWRADGTRDHTGQFCYIKDIAKRRGWSATHQPVCAPADHYQALLGTDQIAFHRVDGEISTRTEIAVVPTDSAEVRRVTVTNNSDKPREIELTSYGEIVLAPPGSDRAHPAFSNLFVQTEWHEWCTAITAVRRPRSAGEPVRWCVHVMDSGKERIGPVSYETDRARFIGRGRTTRDPLAAEHDGPLSGTTGDVLDPIFALRTRVRLQPGQSASVAFTTLIATTRERAFELAGRYHDPHAAQRALDLAWTTTQIELRELSITPADAGVFQEIAGHLLHGHPSLGAPRAELLANTGSQGLLWGIGISGDWPILLAMISSSDGLPTLRQLFIAHHYWRRRGMTVDLVIVNTQARSYQQALDEKIAEAMMASGDSGLVDMPGGVFIRRQDAVGARELAMLRATARVHITCDGRPLGRIMDTELQRAELDLDDETARSPLYRVPGLAAATSVARAIWRTWADLPAQRPPSETSMRSVARRRASDPALITEGPALRFDNGYGGLTEDASYEIRIAGDQVPPAPWINIIANPFGGFQVSERGGGCSWAGSGQFYRLTPWSNDPVCDPPGDVIYLQDTESGEVWCPTPAPIPGEAGYSVRHAPGVSTFDHAEGGIATRLTLSLADDSMTRVSILRITNHERRPRKLRMTAYAEWTLGFAREQTCHQLRTEYDPGSGAILAQNFFDPQFAPWVAFHAVTERVSGFTADRSEFLGRNGSMASPAALRRAKLSGTTGAGMDPCSALQCVITLGPGETREIAVLLGAAPDGSQARELLARYRSVAAARSAADLTIARWDSRLSVIKVRTPEPSFDAMLNRWTLYQALACRMWGRMALYQSSGAYGFRDQLQDVMAFLYAEPAIAREHILRAAARQFIEGDVQHWWHPESGRGVRTRCSDDLVWLPFVVDQYVRVTGDQAILDEVIPFLTGRLLKPDEHEAYEVPEVARETGSLYEHCLRALRKASTEGVHGLPLIGTGDWNDGMNRVGVEGKGESIWLAWFLTASLRAFAVHALARGDQASAAGFLQRANAYAAAVENDGWDGEWYRRAYFDDGTPLGSDQSEECRIDSIAQSWSIISGAAPAERQARAMQSLAQHLVDEDARLIMLLTPAFDKTLKDPGYIKGYLPGVRENGAQYTHAALWVVLANALHGKGERAFELFQMINPLTHGSTRADVDVYKVEPYVVAADIYTAPKHLGRGGWTWYTGSASWMYRVGLEAILGFTRRGNRLEIRPRVPGSWPDYGIEYRFGGSTYAITVLDPGQIRDDLVQVRVDGKPIEGVSIPLVDDGARHEVVISPVSQRPPAPGQIRAPEPSRSGRAESAAE